MQLAFELLGEQVGPVLSTQMVSELAQRALQGGNLLRDVTTAVDHALREPLPMLWWVVPEFCQRAPRIAPLGDRIPPWCLPGDYLNGDLNDHSHLTI